MRVVLIHGMGRTSTSLALLSRRLRNAGHLTSSFGYFVSRAPLDVIADNFVAHIDRHTQGEPFAIVGHSLGNVVTRLALSRLPQLERIVMLAPPNQPPALARILKDNPLFRALTRDAGQRLADATAFYASLPVPQMPVLIVAGTLGAKLAGGPWQGPTDGIVGLEETRLPSAPNVEHVTVPAMHTLIMNSAVVTGLALRFLNGESATEASVSEERGQ